MCKTMGRGTCKRWLILLGIVIVLFRVCYICAETEVTGAYEFSTGEGVPESSAVPWTEIVQRFSSERSKLNQIKFLFPDLTQENVGTIFVTIEHDGTVIYKSKIPLSGLSPQEWYRLYVNMPVEPGDTYILRLVPLEDTVVPPVRIVDNGAAAPEEAGCAVDGTSQSGQMLLRFGYLRAVTWGDRLVKSAAWLLVLLLYILIVNKAWEKREKIQRACGMAIDAGRNSSALPLLIIAELLLCYFTVENSGITFQPPVKAVLYGLSLLACTRLDKKLCYAEKNLAGRWKKIGFCLLDLYAAFAMMGNRLFLYPLNKQVNGIDIFIFFVSCLWLAPILLSGLYGCDRLRDRIRSKEPRNGKRSTVIFCALSVLLLLIPAALVLYAYNPGISSPDTVGCLAQFAHDIRHMTDWHPPFYCLLLAVIAKVWDSPYAVVLVQWFFWAYVMVEALLFLRRRGIGEGALLLFAAASGCNTGNALLLCSIWKDVPYSVAVLWLAVLVARLVLEESENRKKWYIYLELAAALVLTCLVRQNGIVPYVLLVLVLGVVLRKNKRLLLSLGLSLVLILIVRGPIYSYLNVADGPVGGKYIGLGQDVMGVYYTEGDVTEDTLQMVNALTGENSGGFAYSAYRANSYYTLDVSIGKFIRNYLDTFIRNPSVMTREILCRQDGVWDLFWGQDFNMGWITSSIEMNTLPYNQSLVSRWVSMYPRRVANQLTSEAETYITVIGRNQLLHTVIFKGGPWLLLAVMALFYGMTEGGISKRALLISLPLFGHILGLFLSTGWNDLRYYWPINIISPFVVLVVLAAPKVKKEE